MKKSLFVALGMVCVGLGAIGVVVPVLPTTPFLLLAMYLFSRSSPKMQRLLQENKVFGKYLSNYFNNRPIPLRQKLISTGFLWLGLGSTFYFADLQRWVIGLLICVGIAVSVHIATLGRFRLRKTDKNNKQLIISQP